MSDDVWKRNEIVSPCVKLCAIHPEARICTGCLRSMDEIAGWSRFTDAERQKITAELAARRPLLANRRGGRAGRLSSRNGGGQ